MAGKRTLSSHSLQATTTAKNAPKFAVRKTIKTGSVEWIAVLR
jgi:hypothetical protein